jgi:hypothetical protein
LAKHTNCQWYFHDFDNELVVSNHGYIMLHPGNMGLFIPTTHDFCGSPTQHSSLKSSFAVSNGVFFGGELARRFLEAVPAPPTTKRVPPGNKLNMPRTWRIIPSGKWLLTGDSSPHRWEISYTKNGDWRNHQGYI